jgi:hypothetical protein
MSDERKCDEQRECADWRKYQGQEARKKAAAQ